MSYALTDEILATYGQATKDLVLALYPHAASRAAGTQIAQLFARFNPEKKFISDQEKAQCATALRALFQSATTDGVKAGLMGLRPFMNKDDEVKNADGDDLGNKVTLLAEITLRRTITTQVEASRQNDQYYTPAQKQLLAIPAIAMGYRARLGAVDAPYDLPGNPFNPTVSAATLPVREALARATKPEVQQALSAALGNVKPEDLNHPDVQKALHRVVVEREVAASIATFPATIRPILEANRSEFLIAMTQKVIDSKPAKTTAQVIESVNAAVAKANTDAELKAALGLTTISDEHLEAVQREKALALYNDLRTQAGSVLSNIPANASFRTFIDAHREQVLRGLYGKSKDNADRALRAAKQAFIKANGPQPDTKNLVATFTAIGLGEYAQAVIDNQLALEQNTELLRPLKQFYQSVLFKLPANLGESLRTIHNRLCAAAHMPLPAFSDTLDDLLNQPWVTALHLPGAQLQAVKQACLSNVTALQQAYANDGQVSDGDFHQTALYFATKADQPQADGVTFMQRMRAIYSHVTENTKKIGKEIKSVDDLLNKAFTNTVLEDADITIKRQVWNELHQFILTDDHRAEFVGGPTNINSAALQGHARIRMASYVAIASKESGKHFKRFNKEFLKNKKLQEEIDELDKAASNNELKEPSELNKVRLEQEGLVDQLSAQHAFLKAELEFVNNLKDAITQRNQLGYQPSNDNAETLKKLNEYWAELSRHEQKLSRILAQFSIAKERLARNELYAGMTAATTVTLMELNLGDYAAEEQAIRRVLQGAFQGAGAPHQPDVVAAIGMHAGDPADARQKKHWTAAELTEGGKNRTPVHIVKGTRTVDEIRNGKPTGNKVDQEVALGAFYEQDSMHNGEVFGSVQRTFLAPGLDTAALETVMEKQAIHLAAKWEKLGKKDPIELRCNGQPDSIRGMQLLRKYLLAHGVPDKVIDFPKNVEKDNKFFGEGGKQTREIKKYLSEEAKREVHKIRGTLSENEEALLPKPKSAGG